jgi:serine/threonine-protein kinase
VNPSAAGVQPGDVLAGKYRVERVLGAGGMGVVVAARHLVLDERVALKFLRRETLENADAVARFDREARAAVKIKSEHVARIIDVGRLEMGAPYIVMEYLEGGDLAAWLQQRGALDIEQAVEFVLQACEAIAEAHALGIIHRDLKPSNLFCVRRADDVLSVKVLDFGISKVTGPSQVDASMTRTTAVVGSPVYMSPEQLQSSRGVDVRTDIWSLGIILFELLTGRPPFTADAVTELVIKIAVEPTPSMRDLRSDVPAELEQAVLRCLEKNRELRFQTVGELAMALHDYAPPRARPSIERILRTLQAAGMASRPRSAMTPPSAPQPQVSTTPLPSGPSGRPTDASWGHTGSKSRTRSSAVTVTVGILGLVVGLGVAALVAWRSPGAQRAATSAAAQPSFSRAAAVLSPGGTQAPPAESVNAPATEPAASSDAPAATADASAHAASASSTGSPPPPMPAHSTFAPPPVATHSASTTPSRAPRSHVYDHM